MKRDQMAIWFLSCTAVALLLACVLFEKPAQAQLVSHDRDYVLMTNPGTGGSDLLYISNNRRGVFAVFVWDTASRSLQVRDVKPITHAFGGGRR